MHILKITINIYEIRQVHNDVSMAFRSSGIIHFDCVHNYYDYVSNSNQPVWHHQMGN